MLDWLPWLEPVAADADERAAARQPGRRRAREVRLLPPAGARSRRARGAHPHRQGHLLQSRRRPAARRARARRRRDLAAERLHLLRLGACALRRDLFQAHGRRRQAAGRGHRRRSRQALERHRRRLGGADRDADLVRARAHRRAARGRAGRRRHRRRHQRRLVLQLGQPPDAVAGEPTPATWPTPGASWMRAGGATATARRCRACRGRCSRPDPRRSSLPSARCGPSGRPRSAAGCRSPCRSRTPGPC